jgi:predicted RNase H-like HicB family nuclease
MQQYVVIIESGDHSFGAYVPDLPGCVAVAETRVEVLDLIAEAIEFHLGGLRETQTAVPLPRSTSEYVAVSLA